MGWGRQFAIVALVNVLVLVAGLVFFSQDGKLLTYAAMTLAEFHEQINDAMG